MRYTSTRDSSISKSFEEAMCSGYAPDGGLFVPQVLPKIGVESHLKPWAKLTFPELAQSLLRLFVSTEELTDIDLSAVCSNAFNGFLNPDQAVPVLKVGSVFVAELFHGPTFCFKDLGMRPVVSLLSHFSSARNRRTTLLVSTTGDTGPAAVRAVSDLANPLLKILVHYPEGQISSFQRKQLTTVQSECVHVVKYEGGGDDMDVPIKNLLLAKKKDSSDGVLCGVNSYNIGRPLMQMVHFVWTYLRVAEMSGVAPGDPNFVLDIVLPTGAMGNIAGGYMAKKMGLPLGKLCAGVNINDVTHRVIQKGEFHKSNRMHKTLSEAINIQLPYNFERLLFYLTREDHMFVRDCMTSVERTAKLDLEQEVVGMLQEEFRSARVTDEELCEATRSVQGEFGYLCDPHTAVAVSAAEQLGYKLSAERSGYPVALLATASPCKFEESVTTAIGIKGWKQYYENDFPEWAQQILSMPERPPTIFRWREGASLEATQQEWERDEQQILDRM